MTITTGLAVYFLVWWVVLFAVLPFGVRSQVEHGEVSDGTDPGAPAISLIGRKLLATTVVASIIFAGLYVTYTRRWITLDDLHSLFGLLG